MNCMVCNRENILIFKKDNIDFWKCRDCLCTGKYYPVLSTSKGNFSIDEECPHKWISVKESLPKKHTYVLTCSPTCHPKISIKFVFTNVVKEILSSKSRFYKVTHWMPLPSPPENDTIEEQNGK